MNIKSVFTSLITLLCIYTLSLAQDPGDFDLTYATNGILNLPLGTANAFSRSMVIQPDGKAVVACIVHNGISNDFAVIRLTSEGQLDTSFGTGGIVITDFDLKTDIAEAIALDEFNRIIVAGSIDNGNGFDFGAARYLEDGTLDETFHKDGLVTTPLGITSFCNTVAVQLDNKIILGGYTFNPVSAVNEFALVRYHTDGKLDETFDEDGIVMTHMGIGSGAAFAMALQEDGKIVLSGQVFNESSFLWNIGIARYHENGSLDKTFDGDGIVLTETPGVNHTINAVALQSDHKIIVAGYNGTAPSNNLFTVARYHMDGTPDDGFGTGGLFIDSYGAQDNQITAVAIQPDGQILVAGTRLVGNADQFALARIDLHGNFDKTFGENGVVISIIGQNDGISAMALQEDGKLVVAGESFDGNRFELIVTRYETGLATHTEEPEHSVFDAAVYPNPAVDEVKFSYTLKKETEMRIALFDVSGRLVHILANQRTQMSGNHEEYFELPAGLPYGSYWLSFESGSLVTALQLIVVK